MKHFLLSCLVLMLMAPPAKAQSVLGNYKYRVDTSIVNKTAASSVTRSAIGGRFKELADIVQGVSDNSLHPSDTLSKLVTRAYAATLIYNYLTSLPGFANGRVLSVQGSALIWAAVAAAAAGDFNNDFNNDFSH